MEAKQKLREMDVDVEAGDTKGLLYKLPFEKIIMYQSTKQT